MADIVKLMKPLFIDMNFNREGKRIRAKYIKTLSFEGVDYPLWVSAGKDENDFPQATNDTHYLMIQAGDYLVPCGLTEYNLEQRSGYAHMVPEWYGNQEVRNEHYSKIRNGKIYEESDELIEEQIAKENEAIVDYGKDENVQAEYLKKFFVDPAITAYIEARDNGGKFASFQGAAFLSEIEKCYEINKVIKVEGKKAEAIKKAERLEREKKESEAKVVAELVEIKKAEEVFVNGGIITDTKLIVKIADQYGIDIPIRTRGWILNSLVECTISDSGSMSCRYWKTKGGKGSQKVYEILYDIRNTLKDLKIA